MSVVGNNIKRVRKEKGISQKQLGEMLGVSQAAIGQFESENSNPKYETLEKIADCLSVPITELLTPKENVIGIINGNIYQGDHDGYLRFQEVNSIKGLLQFLSFYNVTLDKQNFEFVFNDTGQKHKIKNLQLLTTISAKQIKILIEELSNNEL